ncbi:MAG: helix-turn-helix transcriptional regulator [Ruminococcaceae bacterium]|nr:helix-turn-helix transcriptional regulator [Oscillospiraceae bacterium]
MVNGQRIKELMLAKGMDSRDLAERIGISAPMMSYIIRNLRDTNVTTLVRIARILEVPVDELIVKEG